MIIAAFGFLEGVPSNDVSRFIERLWIRSDSVVHFSSVITGLPEGRHIEEFLIARFDKDGNSLGLDTKTTHSFGPIEGGATLRTDVRIEPLTPGTVVVHFSIDGELLGERRLLLVRES